MQLKSMKPVAGLLIALGLAIIIWGAFGFITREQIIDVGPIHASKDKEIARHMDPSLALSSP
jgi:hypothetical protein